MGLQVSGGRVDFTFFTRLAYFRFDLLFFEKKMKGKKQIFDLNLFRILDKIVAPIADVGDAVAEFDGSSVPV